ncbi:MAG: hypothetical protein ACREUU_14605 [Gammaproteobacteria bacterium]
MDAIEPQQAGDDGVSAIDHVVRIVSVSIDGSVEGVPLRRVEMVDRFI